MSIAEALTEMRRKAPFRFDPAWSAVALIFLAIALVVPSQGEISAWFTARAVLGVLPFFALSIALAAYANASGAGDLIARDFTGLPALMVVMASLMGALSPLCSCGV